MGRAERIQLARDVSDRLVARYGGEMHGVALFGSVARGDDTDHSDLDVMAIVSRPGLVADATMLIGPTVVTLNARTLEEACAEASFIGPWWPLRADQYVSTMPLHDPTNVFKEIRRAHDEAVHTAMPETFERAAARNLAEAISLAYRARAHLGRDDRACAIEVAEAAVRAVLAVGLLMRFSFKNLSHALRVAPDLPGAPDGVGAGLRAAFAPDATQADAVVGIEDAVEALLQEGMKRNIPFAGEDAAALI